MIKIIKVCLTLSLFISLFSSKSAPVSAVTPQIFPSKLLFYTDSQVTPNQVFYIDPITLDLKRLLVFQEHEFVNGAFWSPDGKNFAVMVQSKGQRINHVCIYTEARVKTQCIEVPLLWSRSTISFPTLWYGDQIYMLLESIDGLPQIGIINVSTNTLSSGSALPIQAEELDQIRWSPDARFVAFQTRNKDAEEDKLKLHSFDIKNENEFFVDTMAQDCFAWSSDGMQLGYWHGTNDNAEFHVANFSKVEPLQFNLQLKMHITYGCPFAWSNDDHKIAFANIVGKSSERYTNIVVVSIDGKESYIVGDKPQLLYGFYILRWSPDNQFLAVQTIYDAFNDVRVFSLDGWHRTYTLEGILLKNPVWQPLGG